MPISISKEGVADNGPLMRLAPVPLLFYRHPADAVEYSGKSALITHGDTKAYDACRYYGALIVAAVNGTSRDKLLDKNFYEKHKKWFGDKSLHSDIMNIAHGSYQKEEGYAKGIRGKGYIVSALEAALWAFWSDGGSSHKAVLAAINLGDDTDTTAAIYGQLAGAHYGFSKLPEKWVDKMYAKKFIKCLSKWIVYEGGRWPLKEPTMPAAPTVTVHSQPTEKQGHGSKSSENNQTEQMKPISMSEQYGDSKSNFRPRRYIFHDKTFTLQSHSHEQHASDPSNLAEKQNSTSSSQRVYFHDNIKSVDDVCCEIVLLGDDYAADANAFQEQDINGYWLLNQVDDKYLIKLGVKNKDHRKAIFRVIERVKKECPVQYVPEKN